MHARSIAMPDGWTDEEFEVLRSPWLVWPLRVDVRPVRRLGRVPVAPVGPGSAQQRGLLPPVHLGRRGRREGALVRGARDPARQTGLPVRHLHRRRRQRRGARAARQGALRRGTAHRPRGGQAAMARPRRPRAVPGAHDGRPGDRRRAAHRGGRDVVPTHRVLRHRRARLRVSRRELAGCVVACYVHYPTILSDMFARDAIRHVQQPTCRRALVPSQRRCWRTTGCSPSRTARADGTPRASPRTARGRRRI